jgi:hypothetical protein
MQTLHRIRCTVAAILLVLYLPGCLQHYVTSRQLTPPAVIGTKHPKQVRVTLVDSSRVVLREPWATADSLGGRSIAQDARGAWKLVEPQWAVPLAAVRRLEVREANPGLSVALYVGILTAAFFIAASQIELTQY